MATERQQRVKNVVGIIRLALEELGFKKRAGTIFTCQLTGDVLGQLSFCTSYYPRTLAFDMDVPVGVRHQTVENVVTDLMELKGQPYLYAASTIFTQLGYLMPEEMYKCWDFTENVSEDPKVVQEMIDAIKTYGIPFMKENTSLQRICEKLEEKGTSVFSYYHAYSLPVGYHFMGRTNDGLRFIEREIKTIADRTDDAAELYRKFAANFRQWVS